MLLTLPTRGLAGQHVIPSCPGSCSGAASSLAAEFLEKIDQNSGVNPALGVEQFDVIGKRDDHAMPNVGMDGEAARPVALECRKTLRPHVVARQRQRHDITLAVQRIEQLATVGVIICAPDQRLPAWWR